MKEVKNALKISAACIFTYLASYLFRNLLSVFTPYMLSAGAITKETAALLSSVYMVVYASGQLVCGIAGDYAKPKYMIAGGLCIAALGLSAFPTFDSRIIKIFSFALLGLGMSALRGPLVKTISENMKSKYARISCVFLSFASFFGPFIAGLFAICFRWDGAFYVSAGVALLMAVLSFVCLTVFEKKGLITRAYVVDTPKEKREKFSVLKIFKLKSFPAYLLIGMVVEISASSISFWIPTYVNEQLKFSADASGMIFSAISFLKAFSPFLCLLVLKLFRNRDMHLIASVFFLAALIYLAMPFVTDPWLNIALFLLALVATSIGSATMWSVYIPSLGKSGKVSGANGILDCSGYAASAAANMLFVSIMESGGWNATILSWGIVAFVGAGIALTEVGYRVRHKEPMEIE